MHYIAVAVGFFAKFVSEPTDHHWQGVKRIMRYLKGTWNHELVLGGNRETSLHCQDTRTRTGQETMMIGNQERNMCSTSTID